MLSRSTRTIVQQVEAMKRMVGDFAEYARPIRKQRENLDLLALVQEIIVLYSSDPNVQIELQAAEKVSLIKADELSIRQVLHNIRKPLLSTIGATSSKTQYSQLEVKIVTNH